MAQTHAGAMKVIAKKLGISDAEFQARIDAGEKYCTGCKMMHPRTAFGEDASRHDGLAASCVLARKRRYDATYIKIGRKSRKGILLAATRDGDRRQARRRVNHLVESGRLTPPSDLPCKDCGHVATARERHEYDHYKGYGAEYQLAVEPVCIPCHKRREVARGALKRRNRAQ